MVEAFGNLHILKLTMAAFPLLLPGTVLTGFRAFLGVLGVNEAKLDKGVSGGCLSKGVAGGVSNMDVVNSFTGMETSSDFLSDTVSIAARTKVFDFLCC